MSFRLLVAKCPGASLALTNQVYVSEQDFANMCAGTRKPFVYLQVKQFVFNAVPNPKMEQRTIGFSSIQRSAAMLSLKDEVECALFNLHDHKDIYLGSLELEVNFFKRSATAETIESDALEEKVKSVFDLHIFTLDQKFVLELYGITLLLKVISYNVVDLKALKEGLADTTKTNTPRGLLTSKTMVNFTKAQGSSLTLKGVAGSQQRTQLFRPDWNFESMGIGGLDNEFSDIFRRAFASRVFPPSVVAELGINHVKGILLYGPPGTGKTLLARQIGKMLNGREPKVINGPEVLNKYVGQSEENVRNLFADAEKEYAERGDESELHIIIFDEIDAICKQRGSSGSGTGVHDTVVNQLLSKIDGVNSINNILLIGMTNRKDMIDEALLRPGRLEVHMEIGLPNEHGRVQIFNIHTAKMTSSNHLGADVDILELAALAKNYTGAEIEAVVKTACSYALNRCIDGHDPTKPQKMDQLMIMRDDFLLGLTEIQPKFGATEEQFDNFIGSGLIPYGPAFDKLTEAGRMFVQQAKTSTRTPLVSVLVEGLVGTGKTAFAADLAQNGGFPFVKIISPEQLVGYSEAGKVQQINKVFEDAYKSPISCVVVDDIERLLEYVQIGPRFSNHILQALMVLLKKPPPKGRKMLVVGTTSRKQVMSDMGLLDVFHTSLHVPLVSPGDELTRVLSSLDLFPSSELPAVVRTVVQALPVKKLLLIAEMARQVPPGPDRAAKFTACVQQFANQY
mmetsp:Transcript_18752/g.72318  ORF Transcript_18752/g.72318 Transcript_18752/m.72318 type:complete len:737 (-) Transcript_18752:52-2262(-)